MYITTSGFNEDSRKRIHTTSEIRIFAHRNLHCVFTQVQYCQDSSYIRIDDFGYESIVVFLAAQVLLHYTIKTEV